MWMFFVLSIISGQRFGHILTGAVSLFAQREKKKKKFLLILYILLATVLAVW